jgi:hypothetical protein
MQNEIQRLAKAKQLKRQLRFAKINVSLEPINVEENN